MDAWGIVSAAGSAAGGAAATGAVLRGWWSRREVRQQRAFRRAVQEVVDASVTDILARQREFERRQGAHLDRQDQAIARLHDRLLGRGQGGRRD